MAITYYGDMQVGYEGQIANMEFDHHLMRSAHNAGTTVIPFGAPVVADSGESGGMVAATGTTVSGINIKIDIYEKDAENLTADGRFGIAPDRPMTYMKQGVFYGFVEQAVTPADPVFYRVTTGTAPDQLVSRYRKDSDGGKANALPTAKFYKPAGPGIVPIELVII